MASSDSQHWSGRAPADHFATTQWSLVLAAQDKTSPEAREALAALCRSYWYPLYAFIRRQGFDSDQAQDLIQEFFTRLLEKDFLGTVNPEKGKFRSFLLKACTHFLANERDRARAQKRGGDREIVSLSIDHAEHRYGREPAHTLTPERLFERNWALTLLEQVLARLKSEMIRDDKGRLFESLKIFLTGEGRGAPYRQLAADLGLTEGAVKVAVYRLRQRYRELLLEEIGRTVEDPADIDAEIDRLFAALGD
jgi:RNA polymerase sigma-70 factor (ECF subfamily)